MIEEISTWAVNNPVISIGVGLYCVVTVIQAVNWGLRGIFKGIFKKSPQNRSNSPHGHLKEEIVPTRMPVKSYSSRRVDTTPNWVKTKGGYLELKGGV